MYLLDTILVAALALKGALALPHVDVTTTSKKHKCPPFSGSFEIDYYQVYPENADFDFDSCLFYISCVWNATLMIYDPYKHKVLNILSFPGISHTTTYHVSGVGVDQRTGLVSIVVDSWAAIVSGGSNLTGDNFLLQLDPATRELVYKINLTETTQNKYSGFGDVEQDPKGNVYVVGGFPSSILKVDKYGENVTPWYLPEPIIPTNAGLNGLAAHGWTLLANDANSKILKFDMRDPVGTPVLVPHHPNMNWTFTDAIYLPRRYHGTVLLLAEDLVGIIVLRSRDGRWDSAEFLGKVLNTVPNSYTVAPAQIGESIYLIPTEVGDINKPNTGAGTQDKFPIIDITAEVDALLAE
ncbi:Core trichothecene cluster (CTC) protein [Lachnellula suecica]|uniref:Core trichothecene cluster (CTC) protein n=1 Tax=Lachnellula suecica TaxID=602035 RepID=A0A8T9C252_9HELO|nr:Core trichothecene cluster (CTC) protein [Lachnellula suecica]